MKARKFTHLDATSGTKVSMSVLLAEIPISKLSAAPGGDTMPGHKARRSMFVGSQSTSSSNTWHEPSVLSWIIQMCAVPKPLCCQLFTVTPFSNDRETLRKAN